MSDRAGCSRVAANETAWLNLSAVLSAVRIPLRGYVVVQETQDPARDRGEAGEQIGCWTGLFPILSERNNTA